MVKGNNKTKNIFKKNKKVHTVVKFDQQARKNYLNAFVGAKKRRKQFGQQKKMQAQKQQRRDDKRQIRQERKKEIQKIKEQIAQRKQESDAEKLKNTINYSKGSQQVSITTTFA